MKIFRITIEVGNLDKAAAFYSKLLGDPGKRHPGARHYFNCDGVILAVIDPKQGGMKPTPGPKSIDFALHVAPFPFRQHRGNPTHRIFAHLDGLPFLFVNRTQRGRHLRCSSSTRSRPLRQGC